MRRRFSRLTRRSLIGAIVGLVFAAAAGAKGNGQDKMDVGPQPGNGGEHTINIAARAVPAHVAHGDTVGACSGASTHAGTTTTTPTTSTSATTSTTASPTTTGKRPHKPKKENLHASTHSTITGSTSHGNSGHTKSGTSSTHGHGGHASGSHGHGHGGGKGHGK